MDYISHVYHMHISLKFLFKLTHTYITINKINVQYANWRFVVIKLSIKDNHAVIYISRQKKDISYQICNNPSCPFRIQFFTIHIPRLKYLNTKMTFLTKINIYTFEIACLPWTKKNEAIVILNLFIPSTDHVGIVSPRIWQSTFWKMNITFEMVGA